MSIFEKESSNFQNRNYRAHLNRNWQNGNDEFRAINERLSKINQNENNNSEIIASHVDLHGIDYKSLPFRLDNMQIIGENANQLANSINNKINTLVEDKLAQIDNSVHAYPNADSIKQAYPNGKLGIFVAVDTGHQWYWVDGSWKDGGFYQASAPIDDIRAVDAKVISNANLLKSLLADLTKEVAERKKIDADLIDKVASYLTALELKEVRLKDNANNLLWNGNSYVTGKTYLPKTDKTGLEEGLPVDSSIVGYTFLGHLEEHGLPILKLESPDLPTLTKGDGKLKGVKFTYSTGSTSHAGEKVTSLVGEFSSVKVQGASSAIFPKKNYTLKFDSDVCLKGDWGYHDKYVIKADWVDFSQMRNEFGAYLWRKIRETRIDINYATLADARDNNLVDVSGNILSGETRSQFAMGLGLGAIDSYPIFVVLNGVYHGLYNMTIPKDDWMAGMGYGTQEAIVSANTFTDATSFKAKASTDSDGNLTGDDFEVEYVTDEDNQAWISSSLNAAIDEVMNASNLSDITLIDKESLIDYVCLSMLTANVDGISKNYLLDTFDGTTWFFAAYDMDLTFGNEWGSLSSSTSYAANYFKTRNKLFELVLSSDDYTSRIAELKSSIISKSNLVSASTLFADRVQSGCFAYEALRWPTRKNTRVNTAYQITNWLENRIDEI
ncbi:MAG: CotH kinase family protein [Ligilactobacillus agilis]|uniref:CotH kinase family protein n=1 Tax=Ligilactobacillus agilis TaxID=1601 RepID=UPI00243046A4|nr:CotH kinase family protein [Ligilactobacillus agilis]MCI5762682.1 CotH kinase family protein [Ligilactobacillus agilis]